MKKNVFFLIALLSFDLNSFGFTEYERIYFIFQPSTKFTKIIMQINAEQLLYVTNIKKQDYV
jgi:hypothetical protein